MGIAAALIQDQTNWAGKLLKRRAAPLTTDQGWDDIAKARVALTPSAK